jgi:uncharacterized protein (TIGR00730 family)
MASAPPTPRPQNKAAIGVFCASARTLDQRWLDLATRTGRELAGRGHTLVSGGGCVGMMGAVADGTRAGGGYTIGVMPQSLVDLEIADTNADELVVTDGMASRKNLMIEKSDAFLVLPGGLGTLDELFEVWTTAMLAHHRKPIALLDVDGFYTGLLDWLGGLAGTAFIRPGALELLIVTDSLPAAFDAIEVRLGAGGSTPRS